MGIQVLENDRLTVWVSDDGAERFGVFDKEIGAERIRNNRPACGIATPPFFFPLWAVIAGI